MKEVKDNNTNRIVSVIKPVLNLFNLLAPKNKSSLKDLSTPENGLDAVSKLTKYIDSHCSFLHNEFMEFINNTEDMIFCFDNSCSNEIDDSIRTNSQLELLYQIIGKDEFENRVSGIVKELFLKYKSGAGLGVIFEPGDIIKSRENDEDPGFWIKIINCHPKYSNEKIVMQFLNDPKVSIKSKFSNEFLLEHNPEFLIRFLISREIDIFKKKDPFEDDDWNDGKYNFWDDIPKRRIPVKNYSFVRLLDAMTAKDGDFHSYRIFYNDEYQNVRPRFKLYYDILGRENVKEKIFELEKRFNELSPIEINKTPIFRKDDFLVFEDLSASILEGFKINIFIVESQNPVTLEVTLYNAYDKSEIKVASQEELLKENPQYVVRL